MSTTTSDVQPRPLTPDALVTYLRERLEQRVVDHVIQYGQLTVTVAPEAVPSAVQLCRDDPHLAFDFFDFMTGVDEREDGFAVVTHLYSIRKRHHIQIRALAHGGRSAPRMPTISHLYAGINWHEREIYDMFGVTFDGHPALLPRILTVENFEGFPLRKDFLLMTREVKPWPGFKEPKAVEEETDEAGTADAPARGPSAEDKARMAREKAERAKAKAAEARQRRAQEQAGQTPGDAGQQAAPAGGDQAGTAAPAGGDQAGTGAPPAPATHEQAEAATQAERPGSTGELGATKQAQLAYGAGEDETAGDPRGAAEVAGAPIAKDAAAGAIGGDTAAGAPGDEPGVDEPVEDLAREAEIAGGADARPGATPGVEAGGRRAGDPPLPPRGPGEEEPRGLSGDGVTAVPLADEQPVEVGETYSEDPEQQRPIGTDADDRLHDLESEQDEEDQS